ncbi:MAG: hypothetical protein IPO13_01525 [Rhodocyclaceae bacterium]|nr:hypothetical protein [Rhodocyclaceae bacterium]
MSVRLRKPTTKATTIRQMRILLQLSFLCFGLANTAIAADAAKLYAPCQACHGAKGEKETASSVHQTLLAWMPGTWNAN